MLHTAMPLKFINEKYDLNMSKQTVYNYNDTEFDEYLTQKETLIEEKLEENNIELDRISRT